uniref:Density-regulated protein n=1 Tax=Acrobeloides nanus TaxID=290746 RepID=A0A914CUZ1_9BILA
MTETENEFQITGSETSPAPIPNGPAPCVKYSNVVYHCGECSMPIEYCKYSGKKDKCRQWLEQNLPEMIAEVDLTKDSKDDDGEKKDQKRDGKGAPRAEKVEKGKTPAKITFQLAIIGNNKYVTVIKGLTTFELFDIPEKWKQVDEDSLEDFGDQNH